MAYAYGTTLGSTIRMYAKYDVVDTDLTYTITIQEIGLYSYSDTYMYGGCDKDSPISITAFGRTESDVIERNIGVAYKKTYLKADNFTPFSNTYTKTNTPQTVAINGSMKMSTWERVKGSTGTYISAGTSTLSFNITVPALARPVASITATRDANTPTTLGISVTVNSFEDDEISSITVVDGNGNPLGSTSSTIVIPSSGQIVQPFVVQGVTTGSIVAKVVVIGLGGASAEASVVIPVAFFTMDVQNGGKEIAFGSSAIDETAQGSEHGIFNCFMEAKFHNGLSTESPLFKTATVTTTSRSWAAKGTALGQYNYKPDTIEGYTPIALVGANSGNTNVIVAAHYNGSVVVGHVYNHNTSAVSTDLRLRFLYVQNGLV